MEACRCQICLSLINYFFLNEQAFNFSPLLGAVLKVISLQLESCALLFTLCLDAEG
jgi:hypothetical protein